jgi:hypothetical protein
MPSEAEKIIAQLGLAPLPREGGFFRQTWLSRERLADGRAAGSAVLFLITHENFSALHRLETDEIWHFSGGDPVVHLQLDPHTGQAQSTRLGSDPFTDVGQLVVPRRVWQGAKPAAETARGWSLLACTMAPAWDEREFTLGERAVLTRAFPAQTDLIASLTR